MMPKRIQLSRRKGWQKPAGAIVVARPSKFGNPFRRNYDGRDFRGGVYLWGRPMSVASDAQLVEAFVDWLAGRLFPGDEWLEPKRQWILAHLPDLRGYDLCCWCGVGPCHADVLLHMARRRRQRCLRRPDE